MNPHLMKYFGKPFLMICVAATVAGCASAPSHFYTLNSTAKAVEPSLPDCAVVIEPVFVPTTIDHPQFLTVISPNVVEFDEFNRWAGPLDENIASVIGTDLGLLLGSSHVASAPLPGFGPAYHVTIRMENFEFKRGTGKAGGEAVVRALWTVRNPAGQKVGSNHTLVQEPVSDGNREALVAAYSHALATVSTDIATIIRTADGKK
jgi:uncharacterized lipoprotein YmbA